MAADYFAERREIGIINIGGDGQIILDNKKFLLENKDAIYIGRGVKKIESESLSAKKPAMFYFVSYPAHKEYPSAHLKYADATPVKLGSQETANKRTIYFTLFISYLI